MRPINSKFPGPVKFPSPPLFMSNKLCLKDRVTSGGILVKDGKIHEIILVDHIKYAKSLSENVQVIDAGNNVLMAGIVDSHVHVNEPGRTEWEGYKTATQAASAGGITTIVDMPLNSIPPTTTLENFRIKKKSTEGQIYVDVAFWGGLISGNAGHLKDLISEGIIGFKCFMCPSGVDEFPNVNDEDIKEAITILENTDVILAFHAEEDEHIDVSGDDPTKYSTFLKSRPAEMEIRAIKKIVQLCSDHNLKCHIVHLSAAGALPIIKKARENGVKLTVETCHHYLSLKSEEIQDKATLFKCCPAIRDANNREKLWEALKTGLIDQVVSDHSPCTPDLKLLDTGDFIQAWGGISSLQFGLSLFWTEARARGFNLWDIGKYMSRAPSKLCGLQNRKGAIEVGLDADFVIWDPETEIEITEKMIFHKNKITPYLGKKLYGKVLQTIVRGKTVFKNGVHEENLNGVLLKK